MPEIEEELRKWLKKIDKDLDEARKNLSYQLKLVQNSIQEHTAGESKYGPGPDLTKYLLTALLAYNSAFSMRLIHLPQHKLREILDED